MKEIPILFSTPMVQAILEGRKTMTRRVIKPRSYITDVVDGVPYEMTEDDASPIKCPYGQPGDVLWVRESCCYVLRDHAHDLLEGSRDNNQWVYKTSVHPDWMIYAKEKYGYKWKPAIHMPKEACRIKLLVKSVKVESLQDISAQDAIAEGIEYLGTGHYGPEWKNYLGNYSTYLLPKQSFKSLWGSINGKESWEANPYVWVIEFERIKSN